MDDTPNYQRYSLEELYDVAQHIDKEKYPERYALVVERIANQENQRKENPSAFQDSNETKGGCVGGCSGAFVGASLGIAAAIFLVISFSATSCPQHGWYESMGRPYGIDSAGNNRWWHKWRLLRCKQAAIASQPQHNRRCTRPPTACSRVS